MLTTLTQEHLDLAEKVRFARPLDHVRIIANFLAYQFQAEDKNFDRANWLKACGL